MESCSNILPNDFDFEALEKSYYVKTKEGFKLNLLYSSKQEIERLKVCTFQEAENIVYNHIIKLKLFGAFEAYQKATDVTTYINLPLSP